MSAEDEYDELVDRAQLLPRPTREQREDGAMSFAYSNLAISTNHRPARDAFAETAREIYGWTAERFSAWAEGREWWVR